MRHLGPTAELGVVTMSALRSLMVTAVTLLALGACQRPQEAPDQAGSPTASPSATESAPVPTSAASNEASDIARRVIERRATEAAIWGMPAVNYDLMRQQMLTKTQGKENQVVYWGRPLDWHNQTLTPNPDTIYSMAFFNTKDAGPIVLDIPPAGPEGSINANIVDIWQMPLEDAGAHGVDQGKGVKLLLVPPGYKGTTPAGYNVLRPVSFGSYALIRSTLASHSDADVKKAVDYAKRVRVYPLSQAANPPQTVLTDAAGVDFDSTIRYDTSFFENLDRIVQQETWLERDRLMIDQLKSLGIEKGKPFAPDAATKQALDAGIREAQAYLVAAYDAGFPPFYEGTHWMFPAKPELMKAAQSGYTEPDSYPVDARGLAYTYAYIGIKRLGAGQFYLIAIKDKNGAELDGGKTYRLHVPPNVPVEQYWSLTAYDRDTHALIRNVDRASRASNNTELLKNPDGSVDVYLGPKAPAGKEANWIPTDAKRGFEVMFRAYGPKKEFMEKQWKMPDLEVAT